MANAKIRMITFHSSKNYGAVLQTYSLMSFLESYSDDVLVIDFNTPHLRSLYPLRKRPGSIKAYFKYLLDTLYIREKKKKYEKFDRFVEQKLRLTKQYDSIDALRSDPPVADNYFTGSDQVFNPNRIPEERSAFYLDFGAEDVIRCSYAASFGASVIPDEKCLEIAGYLDRFQNISVREKSGIDLLKSHFDKKAVEVLDPVFLHDRAFWQKKAEPYPVSDAPYLLYYRLMGNPESDAVVRKIAGKKNLKLVVVTDGFLKWHADRALRDVGPCELLSLYDNAQYIATDSFHGVAFALVFEKQFIFTDKNPALADRALNLMEKTDTLSSASLNGNSGDAVIDYEQIRLKLESLIKQSKKYIDDILNF